MRLFLVGLQRYGKGDWRSISRNVVITRTPTQVASHAQKYFIRQNAERKERKRSSIHDITVADPGSLPLPADHNVSQMPAIPADSPNQQGWPQHQQLLDQGGQQQPQPPPNQEGYQDFDFHQM